METTLEKLKEYYDICVSHYTAEHRRMRLLDATDNGDLWKALGTKMPEYQILPDTNYVSYVKINLLASLYTVVKSASIVPTSDKDKELITQLNIAMDRIWKLGNIGFYQFQAGERAALLNMGVTQVGWDDSLTGGSGDSFYKGNVAVKNISPIKFMRDPFAVDLDAAAYCMSYDNYHKSVFLQNPNYKEKFEKYVANNRDATPGVNIPQIEINSKKNSGKDYYTLIVFWVREGEDVHEIHTVNLEEILYTKEKIQPAEFPFAELYCNLPGERLVGASECAKIFANDVAINLMDSIALTSEYKNQRPPKFITNGTGLNLQAFVKYGNEADHTFIVNGNADKAVYYHKYPEPSAILPSLKTSLEKGIELVTGVDGRYTGRDTGSIITTGGTEEMLNRVLTIDTPKIVNYERYCTRLTKLILYNMIEFGGKRKYFYKKPNTTKWLSVEVDFPNIDKDALFDYEIDISSELPRNKARIQAMANMLMEKQMQYNQEGGGGVQLITEEEWLMFQDLPMKEYMLERMGIQRMNNTVEEVSQVLWGYANLVKQGMTPDDAILAMANTLDQKRRGIMPEEDALPAVLAQSMTGQAPSMMGQNVPAAPMPPGV